jgi:hypothetical protein
MSFSTDMRRNAMKILIPSALLLFLSATQVSIAQDQPLTRAEVRKETLEAICRGDEPAPGDSGLTLRQLFPEAYKGREAKCKMTEQAMAAMREASRLRRKNGSPPPNPTN